MISKKVMPNLTQAERHLIGNHTYSHMQLTKKNREKFKEELVRTNEVLEKITGVEVEYVRPSYGSWDKSFEAALKVVDEERGWEDDGYWKPEACEGSERWFGIEEECGNLEVFVVTEDGRNLVFDGGGKGLVVWEEGTDCYFLSFAGDKTKREYIANLIFDEVHVYPL